MLAVELRSSPTWAAKRLSLVRTYVRTFIAVRLAKKSPRPSVFPSSSNISDHLLSNHGDQCQDRKRRKFSCLLESLNWS